MVCRPSSRYSRCPADVSDMHKMRRKKILEHDEEIPHKRKRESTAKAELILIRGRYASLHWLEEAERGLLHGKRGSCNFQDVLDVSLIKLLLGIPSKCC
jgi:hypothetical protein